MNTTSQRQVDANRRNAMRSTGPKTAQGKARSRRNGLRHGLAAEVLVPEEERAAYEQVMARWEREAGPDNVVERHLIRRAAVASVKLERIERAHESGREGAAREAVRRWEEKQRHRARRKGQDLERDPIGTLADLEASAFGCDWLARQWRLLESPLRIGRAWDQHGLARAHRLLGFPCDTPGPDGDPAARWLWILAATANPAKVWALPRLGDEADLPTDPAEARVALRAFVAAEVDRLEAMGEAHWEAVEGPERSAIAAQAAAADTTRDGQLRQRYEASADRSCNAALRLFLNVRDRRRRELLAIAKEASSSGDTPKAPVGGGWWREVDSEPAPPGFALVVEPKAEAVESAPVAEPSGAPARSEAISAADTTQNQQHKPFHHKGLRNRNPQPTPQASGRTEPRTACDRTLDRTSRRAAETQRGGGEGGW